MNGDARSDGILVDRDNAQEPSALGSQYPPVSRLLNRDFTWLWQGQAISQIGIQMFVIATIFWIKDLTGSATLMGLYQMLGAIPMILLGAIGGAYADRHSRRSIIIMADLLRGLGTLVLAIYALARPEATGVILVMLLVLSVKSGVLTAFSGPALQAAIPDLVPRERIATANSMAQLAFQLAIFIGQGVGGLVFRQLGAAMVFAINGLAYLYAAMSTFLVRIPQPVEAAPAQEGGWRPALKSLGRDLVMGLKLVRDMPGLREMVILSAILTFFTVPIIFLLPFYVEDVLRVDASWYGYILAAHGVGALIGYGLAGSLATSGRLRGWLMMGFIVLQSLGFGLLGLIRRPDAAMALSVLGGLLTAFITVNITTILQSTVDRELRGRVFGLLGSLSASLAPLAMGLTGIAADLANHNIPLIYAICGGAMVIPSLAVISRPAFRSFVTQECAPTEGVPTTELETPLPLQTNVGR
jgi:MFS transporter, DHA3 family, macrolide efflux protein